MRLRILAGKASLWALAALAAPAFATTTINEQFSPSVVNPGDTSTYAITLSNDSLVPLTGARATVFLDNSVVAPNASAGRVTIANGTVLANTCGFTGVTAAAGTTAIVLTGGGIAAGSGGNPATCVFSVAVTSTTAGTFHAVIPANTTPSATVAGYEAIESGLPVQNTTPADVTLQVNGLSPPTGTKSYAPSPAIAGDPVTLTLVLTNPNAGATVPLTTVTDTLPNDGAGHAMVVANPASPTVACTGAGAVNGSVTATPGAGSFTLTGGTIGQSGACTITVRVTVPTIAGASQAFSGALANTLPAGAIGNTRGLTSPSFSQALTVNTPIAVAKSFSPTTISSGTRSRMTITLTNNSTANTLPITAFADNLALTGIRVLNLASSPTPALINPTVLCDGAGASTGSVGYTPDAPDTTISLAGTNVAGPRSGALGKCVITADVTSSIDGAHVNTIAANAVANPAGHASAAASATLTANAQLTVTKSRSPTSVAPGQWTTFTVVINNYSGGPVDNVAFRDVLPAPSGHQMVLDGSGGIPVSNVGCTSGAWAGADGDSELRWTGGTVVAGVGASPGVCTIVFRARVPAGTPIGTTFTNQIPASTATDAATCVSGASLGVCGLGNGPGGPNSPVLNPAAATGTTGVATVTSVAVTKAFAPTSVAQGALSTLTLTIANRVVSGAITAVNLADNLPGALRLAANPAATNTCGGTLQAFPGAPSLLLSGGTVAVRPNGSTEATCAITVRVTGTAVGTHTNTITPADFSSSAGSIPANVSANLTVTTGITATKTFSPTAVSSGGTSRVRIAVTNVSTGDLTGVSINDDDFVTGTTGTLRVANPANAASSCAGSPTRIANPGASQAQLLGASIPAGTTCDFSFDVVTSGSGPWSNRLAIGKITSAEGPTNTAVVSANLTATAASINVNKSFSPVILTGGFPSTLTLTLSNTASAAVSSVGVTDVFPAGIVVYSSPATTTNCPGATVGAVSGDGQVTVAGVTLAAGGSCTVAVQVTSTRFLNLTNTIPAGAVTSAQGYTNPAAVSATLSTLQGLGVNKSFSPAFVAPSATSRLTINLVSTFDPNAPTPLTLTGVTLTDGLPAGVTIAAIPNAATNCPGPGGAGTATIVATPGGGSLVLSAAHIVPGTACAVSADVVAPATTGTSTNVIAANSISTDQGPTNSAQATATLTVVAQPTIAKAFAPATISLGGTSTLTVTLTNPAVVPLNGVILADTLPTGVAVAGTASAGTTCANGTVSALPGSGSISISGATVPAAGSCTFQANVTANAPGTFNNSIPASRLTSNEGLTNPGAANASLLVRATPTVTKAFNPVSIATGGLSTLTITLGNAVANGAISLSSAFTDALPGNVVVAPVPNKGGTCTVASVTATAGASSVTYASGASIPAGGCTITVDVTSAVAGVFTNTVAAGQLATSAGVNQDPAFADLAVGSALVPPAVGKSFVPSTVAANSPATLTLTLGNGNATPLALASAFIDTMPANLVIATPPNLGGTCAAGSVSATAGGNAVSYAAGATIPAGGCTITVDVSSAQPGSYTNTIAAGDLVTDGGSNAQPVAAGLVVVALVPPTLSKAFSPNTINPGGVTRLTLSLGNANATPLTLASALVDTLPAGVTLATPASPGGTCAAGDILAPDGGGSVTFASGATIPAGGCTVAVNATSASNAGSPYTNAIAAGGLATNAGSNGSVASANLFVNAAQPPSVSKAFSPSTILPGAISTLTISLGNGNATGGTLTANLVDTLPAAITVANPPNPRVGGGCTLASIAATAGGSTVTYLAGGAIPAGGCSIAVDVTSTVPNPAPGHANTLAIGALVTDIGTNAVATTDRLAVLAPPTLAKSFAPATIAAGGVSTLTITLGNTNSIGALLTAALVDSLPAGVTVASPNGLGGTCAAGSVTATPGDGSVTFANGASIPAGGCTIVVSVTSATAGAATNTLAVGALQSSVGLNAAAATATLTVLAPPTLAKAFAPTAIVAGGTSTLTITLGNPNASAITLASALVDMLPAGVTVASPNGLAGTCAAGSVTATPGGGSVAFASGASIPAGGCTILVSVTSATLGTVTNTLAAGALQTSAGPNAVAATADLLVTPVPVIDLTIAKSHGGDFVQGQTGATYTLTVSSVGNTPTNGSLVTVTDALPAGFTATAMSGAGWTCNTGTVSCTRSDVLAAGASYPAITLAVTVGGSAPATVTNISTVGGGGDSNAGNNTATDPTTVLARPTVAKAFSPASIPASGVSTLTITLGNANASAATLVAALVDSLPAGLVIASPNGLAGTCATGSVAAVAGSASVTYANGASIPAGGCTIVVSVTRATPGTVTNTLAAGALQTTMGTNATGTSATLTVTAPLVPALSLAKSHAGDFSQGQVGAVYTLTVGNTGNTATSGAVSVTDTLPAGLTATAFAGTGWTCTLAPLACTRADALAAGASYPPLTLTVDVAQSAPASLVNLATASGGSAPGSATASDPTTVNGVCFLTTGTITGSAWFDPDRDAVRAASEAGIAGVPVTLAPRGATTGATRMALLDANGGFTFANVPAGDYTVQVQDAWLIARGNLPVASSLAFPTLAACGTFTAAFPYAPANEGLVGDLVWYDANRNGVQDEWFDGDNDGAVTRNVPDANGEIDYARFEWIDIDGNGRIDPGELNACGLETSATGLRLGDSAGTPLSTRQAGILGAYRFTGLPPGTYTVTLDDRDPVLLARAEAMAATGLCKTLPAGAPFAPPPADTAKIAAKAVGDACGRTTSVSLTATLTAGSLVNLSLDHGIACLASGVPADLSVVKSGPASANGGQAVTYTLVVANAGPADGAGAVVRDPAVARFLATGLTCSAATGGAACPVAPTVTQLQTGLVIPALPAGGSLTLTVTGIAAAGGSIVNTATILPPSGVTDLVPPNDTSTVTTAVTGTVNGAIAGRVWYDPNRNGQVDSGEYGRGGWRVDLLRGGAVVGTMITDADGRYRFAGLDAGTYTVRFVSLAGAGPLPVNGESGVAMPGGGTPGRSVLANITLGYDGGGNVMSVTGQSLPIDPSGVVYDSLLRVPVAGATVTLRYNGGSADAYVMGGSATTVTPANGVYAFFLLPGSPAGTYTLVVNAPGFGFESTVIRPSTAPPGYAGGPSTAVLGVPGPGQPTTYYLAFPLPTTDITNNHLPVDPAGFTGGTAIPTLSEWAIILLALLMAMSGMRARRSPNRAWSTGR